jgi:Arc/MetJ-type ribon-helix-helix transcriptional regulator
MQQVTEDIEDEEYVRAHIDEWEESLKDRSNFIPFSQVLAEEGLTLEELDEKYDKLENQN